MDDFAKIYRLHRFRKLLPRHDPSHCFHLGFIGLVRPLWHPADRPVAEHKLTKPALSLVYNNSNVVALNSRLNAEV
jgi:hypothetical protein